MDNNRDRELQWRNTRGYTFNYKPGEIITPTNQCLGRFDQRGLLSIWYHLYAEATFNADSARQKILDELSYIYGTRRRRIVVIENQISRQKDHKGQMFVEVQIYLLMKELPTVERMLWFEKMIRRSCINLSTLKMKQID